MPFSPLLSTLYLKPDPVQQSKERIKGIQTWKEAVKLSLFTDDMIVYFKTLRNIHNYHLIFQSQNIKLNFKNSIVFLSATSRLLQNKTKN